MVSNKKLQEDFLLDKLEMLWYNKVRKLGIGVFLYQTIFERAGK